MMSVSARSAIEPFHAMDILASANSMRDAGRSIISMAVGQPADPAPQKVRDAARLALEAGRIGYTDALGLASLRQAISTHYQDHYGVDISPDRVAVTTGSSAGFNLAFLAMFDVGDRVAITRPGYPAYRNIMKALGLDVVEIPVGEAEGVLSAERIEQEHKKSRLKGLLLASPANPTGAALDSRVFDAVVERAEALGISVISDEIYHRLNYSAVDYTALKASENCVIINSFSKYYCMTGWRVGWMILPKPLVRAVERISQSLYISAPELSQVAAIAAFECSGELDAIRNRYLENRSLLQIKLPEIGFELAAPMDGAFYAWCHCAKHGRNSMDLAKDILEATGVALTPGHDFDPVDGDKFVRISYAGSNAEITEAVRRLDMFLNHK